MKKSLIITFLLVSLVCQAQEEQPNFWHRPFWHNLTVGAEFCHTVEPSYHYPNGLFRNHPNNSANLMVTYDLNRKWTLGTFIGYYGSHHSGADRWADQYTPEYGNSFFEHFVNEPTFSFGLEATLHVLPLLYKQKTPFDLTLSGRVGKNPRDLDLGLGIGLGYCPIERLKLYARTYYGAFGFPNGALETGFHYHLVAGACYRLGK